MDLNCDEKKNRAGRLFINTRKTSVCEPQGDTSRCREVHFAASGTCFIFNLVILFQQENYFMYIGTKIVAFACYLSKIIIFFYHGSSKSNTKDHFLVI